MAIVTQKIGPISAYAIAKEEGYTGTKEQFATEIGNASVNAQAAAASATEAEGYATSAATSASNAMSTTPAGYNSMMESIAAEYDATATYAVGDYCRYNSEVYRCVTAISAAEAFDSTKWTKVTIGGQLSQLSEDIGGVQKNEMDGFRYVTNYVNGTFIKSPTASPELDNRKTRIRPSTFIYVMAGDVISITNGNGFVHALCVWTGDIGTASRVYYEDTFSSESETYNVTSNGFFCVSIADAEDQTKEIDPADFNGTITITSYSARVCNENGISTKRIILTKTNQYYDTSGSTINPGTTSSSANYICDVIDCSEGDIFTIHGTGADTARPWAIIDSSNNVIAKAYLTFSDYELVIAPANASKLILNNRVATLPDAVSYYGYNVKNMPFMISRTFKYRGYIPNETDLNTVYETGWYIIAADSTITNSPESDSITGQRFVCIYPATDAPHVSSYRIMTYYNNETKVSSTRFFFSGSWHDWSLDFNYVSGALTNGTDLNDLTKAGWYISGANNTHPNCPEGDTITGQRIIIVFTGTRTTGTSSYRVMVYLNNYTGYSAFRYHYSGVWHRWITFGLTATTGLSGEIDLDDLYEMGWKYIAYSATCTNSPETDDVIGQRYVFVCPTTNTGSETAQRMMQYYNMRTGVAAMRIFVSGKWEAWTILSHADANTILQTITPTAQASQGENTGDNLRIVSYNVARYNNNTTTYLSDQKIFNFRKAIGKFNADILCIQEDMQYIDSNGTKESQSYLYLPQYPYNYNGGKWRNVVHSKKPATAHGRVKLTAQGNDYRSIEFALYTIGAKTLLVCSSHPSWNDSGEGGESAAQIAIRLSNYTEIFQFVNREISLPDLTSGSAVTAPEHTHCIICMDGNSATATDKTNLETLAAQNDFILGNGGALGWFYTCQSTTPVLSSLDNIIVSDNIIINNIESFMELWRNLYSDHVPVVADVTLL